MYDQHFGLNKGPFPAKATGTDVFVGPQTANTMTVLKKGLASQDAVIAVSGPAGSGKTTLVAKALDALSDSHKVVRIGRIQLQGTDALEFLLEELGVSVPPRGPIRQFAALRAQLTQLEAQSQRVVVVVEDALRTGAETLSELEALTAADAGDSGGAAIVLMGDERLTAFCEDPQLARLGQRSRQGLTLAPLGAAELRGYLMHCFRLAGADFEFIFDDRCAGLVHELSGGIPRIANNILEAALAGAASSGIQKVSSAYVAEVAKDEFGLSAENFEAVPVLVAPTPPAVPEPAMEAKPEAEPMPELPEPIPELPESEPEPEPESEPDLSAAPEPAVEPEPEPVPEPVIVFSDETPTMDDIPELIQDTLPDLEILAPEVVAGRVPTGTEEPPPELPEPQLDALPELDCAAEDIPEWERDPTLAELKPDLEALEKAMAFAHGDADNGGDKPAPPPEAAAEPASKASPGTPVEEIPDEIPEITLDNAIQARIEDSLIDEPGRISPAAPEESPASAADTVAPEVRATPRKAKKADAEIERIAAELAKAKTIEDVDDKLAETLFGEEINLIASQVIAAGARAESANDEELALVDTAAATTAQAAGSTHTETVAHEEPELEVSLETREHGGEAGLDLSASQRLKTVRALNADLHPSLRDPEETPPISAANEPPAPEAIPESIEDQINTSMTQTLKALNIRPPGADSDAPDSGDDEDDKKGGFFGRFKRS